MSGDIKIGPVPANKRAEWEPLWKGYLDFYQTAVSKETYDTTWARLQDSNEPMFVIGAYVDGRLTGIVHYLYHRSCWTIGSYCYLQDLFVAEDARKLGLGRALIEADIRRQGQRARAAFIGSPTKPTPRRGHFMIRSQSGRVSSNTGKSSEHDQFHAPQVQKIALIERFDAASGCNRVLLPV
jgi:GNAT superfamily N-acetyltransferase